MKTKTSKILEAFDASLKQAESQYLAAKERFLQEAIQNPSDAIASGRRVIEWQEHFNSLTAVGQYLKDEGYSTVREAAQAAVDYFREAIIREATSGHSTCELSNGLNRYRLVGLRNTLGEAVRLSKIEE